MTTKATARLEIKAAARITFTAFPPSNSIYTDEDFSNAGVQLAALLSEIGSLAVLSAMSDIDKAPSLQVYSLLCRQYAKSVGSVLLQKWSVDAEFVAVLKQSGQWEQTSGHGIGLIDITNLATYYTALFTKREATLPPLQTLAAYRKLPQAHQHCIHGNWLMLVVNNKSEPLKIVQTFK